MRKILLLIPTFICPVLILCQTITPIYVENDSVDIERMQFIDPKNGLRLKIETTGHLVHVNDILPDIVKIVIPFKNGKQIILDTVESKYFYNYCVINLVYVIQDSSKFKECSRIVYYLGDRVIIGKMFCLPGSVGMLVNISSSYSYYDKITKDLKINLSKRYKLFRKNLKT